MTISSTNTLTAAASAAWLIAPDPQADKFRGSDDRFGPDLANPFYRASACVALSMTETLFPYLSLPTETLSRIVMTAMSMKAPKPGAMSVPRHVKDRFRILL